MLYAEVVNGRTRYYEEDRFSRLKRLFNPTLEEWEELLRELAQTDEVKQIYRRILTPPADDDWPANVC